MSLTETFEHPDPGYGVVPLSPVSLTLQNKTSTPLSEYVFGTYHVPGIVVGAGDGSVNNTGPFPAFVELTLQWGDLNNK